MARRCRQTKCPLYLQTEVPYAGNKKAQVVLIGECYSPDTEILTNLGWKKFHELDGSELFYSVNPSSHCIELVKAVRYIKKRYDGDFYHYKTRVGV